MTRSTKEDIRLREARAGVGWRTWGPYLSERQWGTVREDYSDNGDAWAYFTHEQARGRAYRWGEDGLAGFSDDKQRLCLALALWNERDPILKERLFGLTNAEGNHGEDVKEYYFYLDCLPTHAYQRWLYKYPQSAFPYEELVRCNAARSRFEMEYELLDTGIFAQDRYFDVQVEYAKASPDDVLCKIVVYNRGPEAAPIHLMPTLWFRNTWSWVPHEERPMLRRVDGDEPTLRVEHPAFPNYAFHAESSGTLLFCENETNHARLWGGQNTTPYVKDGIGEHVVHGRSDTINPAGEGTKAAAHVRFDVPAGGSVTYRVRLRADPTRGRPFSDFDTLIAARRAESDEFYDAITPARVDPDSRAVMRQALAGMLWSKQYYYFDLDQWLRERGAHPLREPIKHGSRNENWFHMLNGDVISMPDKWEYPWYAAWDLAFHSVPLAMVDPDFARGQLHLMLSPRYQHPTGQIPAYEWNFGDVNPPVHASATLLIHKLDAAIGATTVDLAFLKDAFAKLLSNYTWWVNRKDSSGHNLFEGGFLGLDNIGVFDRSAQLPTGGHLEQADGTAWMAVFSQSMLSLSLVLSEHDETYEDFVLQFMQRFFSIAAAVDPVGDHPDEMWDAEDGFFYDVLRMPDGRGVRLAVRSLVGLLPLAATTVFDAGVLERFPRLRTALRSYLDRNADLLTNIPDPLRIGPTGRYMLSLIDEHKLRRILTSMLDEERFLGPHGIRSVSRWHLDHPYSFYVEGREYKVQYEPAESTTGMFGGNSNWRGPVWFPINVLLVRALLEQYQYYGDTFTIECPTGSGKLMTLFEVALELNRRLVSTFTRGADGRRPVYGGADLFQHNEHWRDHILFYEYFHGDNGAGLGASHQTGWTGVVARLIQLLGSLDPKSLLKRGGRALSQPYRISEPVPLHVGEQP
jgi:hypothetical protein